MRRDGGDGGVCSVSITSVTAPIASVSTGGGDESDIVVDIITIFQHVQFER